MLTILYILMVVVTFLAFFGMAGKGTKSPMIANAGSALWLILVVYVFIKFDIKTGLIFLFSSFVFGAVYQNIMPGIIGRIGKL